MEKTKIRSAVIELIGDSGFTEDIVNSIYYSDLLCRYFDQPKNTKIWNKKEEEFNQLFPAYYRFYKFLRREIFFKSKRALPHEKILEMLYKQFVSGEPVFTLLFMLCIIETGLRDQHSVFNEICAKISIMFCGLEKNNGFDKNITNLIKGASSYPVVLKDSQSAEDQKPAMFFGIYKALQEHSIGNLSPAISLYHEFRNNRSDPSRLNTALNWHIVVVSQESFVSGMRIGWTEEQKKITKRALIDEIENCKDRSHLGWNVFDMWDKFSIDGPSLATRLSVYYQNDDFMEDWIEILYKINTIRRIIESANLNPLDDPKLHAENMELYYNHLGQFLDDEVEIFSNIARKMRELYYDIIDNLLESKDQEVQRIAQVFYDIGGFQGIDWSKRNYYTQEEFSRFCMSIWVKTFWELNKTAIDISQPIGWLFGTLSEDDSTLILTALHLLDGKGAFKNTIIPISDSDLRSIKKRRINQISNETITDLNQIRRFLQEAGCTNLFWMGVDNLKNWPIQRLSTGDPGKFWFDSWFTIRSIPNIRQVVAPVKEGGDLSNIKPVSLFFGEPDDSPSLPKLGSKIWKGFSKKHDTKIHLLDPVTSEDLQSEENIHRALDQYFDSIDEHPIVMKIYAHMDSDDQFSFNSKIMCHNGKPSILSLGLRNHEATKRAELWGCSSGEISVPESNNTLDYKSLADEFFIDLGVEKAIASVEPVYDLTAALISERLDWTEDKYPKIDTALALKSSIDWYRRMLANHIQNVKQSLIVQLSQEDNIENRISILNNNSLLAEILCNELNQMRENSAAECGIVDRHFEFEPSDLMSSIDYWIVLGPKDEKLPEIQTKDQLSKGDFEDAVAERMSVFKPLLDVNCWGSIILIDTSINFTDKSFEYDKNDNV